MYNTGAGVVRRDEKFTSSSLSLRAEGLSEVEGNPSWLTGELLLLIVQVWLNKFMEMNQQAQTPTAQPTLPSATPKMSSVPAPETKEISAEPLKKKGWLKILLIILLAIILGAGLFYTGYIYGQKKAHIPQTPQPTQTPKLTATPSPSSEATTTPTTDSTANWNSYSNTKYGYTVKYPQGWESNRGPGNLSDEELSTQRDIDFYDSSLPGSDPGTGLNIRVNELDANGASKNCSDLSDCFSKTYSWLTESTTINESSISFLGVPALTFTLQRGTELYKQSWKYVYFIFTGNAYNINISTNTTREKEIFEVFDRILSTFIIAIKD